MKLKLLLCLALLAGGHGRAQTELPATTRELVAGNTAFALDLYDQVRAQPGNLFFAPGSISTALAMACTGARGETQQQMVRTLHFDLPAEKLPPAMAALAADLHAVQQKKQIQIAEANSLWPQAGFALLPDYLALCRQYFGATVTPVDYLGHTEAAREKINHWVETNTRGKIIELLKPGSLDASSRLVLANAVYFKGKWASPFTAKLTADAPFYVSGNKSVPAPLMQQTSHFGYAEFPDLQVLAMPYTGGDLSMIVLLPRQRDGLGRLESALTPANLAKWTAEIPPQEVQTFLPKFTASSRFDLGHTLQGLGMTDAFNARLADFSGMDGQKDLFISQVAHQAWVEVDEQGTEAAAATGVRMTILAIVQKPVFRADHPFLFLIRDNRTGTILFLGRLTDPTQ